MLTEPGRNDACPCGSGRKFKRCCQAGFSIEDQGSVLGKLAELLRALFGEGLDSLWDRYHGPGGRPSGPVQREDDAFCDWLYFDARDDSGVRMVDRLLRSATLTQGERAYASMMRRTAMRVYAVRSPPFSPRLDLRDIVSGAEVAVDAGDLAQVPDSSYLLAARILPCGPSGWPELHGVSFIFPGELRDELTQRLRAALAEFRATVRRADTTDLFKALAPTIHQRWNDLMYGLPVAPPVEDPKPREEAELRLQQMYEGWIEAPHPALGGLTPRAAVTSGEHRPRLIELLRELERDYERALGLDEPAFDPSPFWEKLGLREKQGETGGPCPPLGHETLASLVPGFDSLAQRITERHASGVVKDLDSAIGQSFVTSDPEFRELFHLQLDELARDKTSLEASKILMDEFAVLVGVRCNFELHLRKVFRVSEDLVWMLGSTSLEGISGDSLRLPFTSFALVFTDRYALSLAERILSRMSGCRLQGKLLRNLTAYVTEFRPSGRPRVVRVVYTCDALDGQRPAVVGLEFPMEPQASLVDILSRQGEGADRGELSPIFGCVPMRQLLHLVMNTILCVTNSRRDLQQIPATQADPRRPSSGKRLSSETIYYLPGTIDISVLHPIQRARRGGVSGEQIHRCMVRGYWRRANPDWKDRGERWIKPHWRGPKESSVVERQYRVKP